MEKNKKQKNNIKTGDILLLKGKTFLSRIIRWFENNEYNHAGIIVKINDIFYVSEAEKTGICLTLLEGYEKYGEYIILKRKEKITIEEENKIINFIVDRTGDYNYDFISLLIKFPIKYLFKKLFKKEIWIQCKKFDSKFTCGEWVAYVINNIFKDKWSENYWQISPSDIYLFSNNYILNNEN